MCRGVKSRSAPDVKTNVFRSRRPGQRRSGSAKADSAEAELSEHHHHQQQESAESPTLPSRTQKLFRRFRRSSHTTEHEATGGQQAISGESPDSRRASAGDETSRRKQDADLMRAFHRIGAQPDQEATEAPPPSAPAESAAEKQRKPFKMFRSRNLAKNGAKKADISADHPAAQEAPPVAPQVKGPPSGKSLAAAPRSRSSPVLEDRHRDARQRRRSIPVVRRAQLDSRPRIRPQRLTSHYWNPFWASADSGSSASYNSDSSSSASSPILSK